MVYEKRMMLTVYKLLTGKEFNTKDCTSDQIVAIMYIADHLGIRLGDVNFQWGSQSGVASYEVEYYYDHIEEDGIAGFYITKYDEYVENITNKYQRVLLKLISDCDYEFLASYLYIYDYVSPHCTVDEGYKELVRRRTRYKDADVKKLKYLVSLLEVK